ncbi:MAG: AAA-like domain-containing protein [Bacteroidetes bacterium]|nr:AAA-like domain-containing protein [Bacteroidota bacterium]MBU1678315.1 AAA-like domain-containing protein [Bacteroidota bacterium]
MNPFSYGSVVSGSYFFNRVEEIAQIKTDLINGNNLILYAPRKYGKTSLVNKVLTELDSENYNTIYLDFFNVIDRNKFIELYAKKLLNKRKLSIEELFKVFNKFVKSLSPLVKIDSFGNPTFEISVIDKQLDSSFEEIVNLPEKWGSDKNRWIIVFDEFQEINKLSGDNFEKELRSLIQFHKNVTYLFFGSKTHMLLNMFRDKARAFYNIGKFIKLNKISEEDNSKFIRSRFQQFEINISDEQIGYILEATERIPFYVQFLCSELWQNVISVKNSIETNDIDMAVEGILSSQSDFYLELYDKLSQYQKKVLLAIVESGMEVYSKHYADKFGLSTSSSTQRAVNKMHDEGIIEKENNCIIFSDPFFKKYIALRFKA